MGVRIGKIVSRGDAQPLSQYLIAAKKEGLILGNGAPQGKSKLVALKTGRVTPHQRVIGVSVKEVAGIQRTVAVKLEKGSVEIVASGSRDGGDYPAGKSSVLGAVSVGDHAKFRNRVHPQQRAGKASRCIALVILDIGSIQENACLTGPGSV